MVTGHGNSRRPDLMFGEDIQQICVLGSTGSIGKSTLDVIARNADRYRVRSLAAGRNYRVMLDQVRQFLPEYAVMADPQAAEELRKLVKQEQLATEVLSGSLSVAQVAADSAVDVVMAAIVGAAGLLPTLAAVKAGKKVLLANKEALVMTGALFMDSVRESGAILLPIDSEHNAIFQCMPRNYQDGLEQVGVERILLTASGGPFRDTPLDTFAGITPEQACAHPNWSMGRKISVDSATMMNKGLEYIEACWLFGATPDQVDVVIHPQSIIHSLVDYKDGSMLAQMGNPDMRTPIAHALAWPDRIASGVRPLSLADVGRLDFYDPCMQRFRCLKLAQEAASAGGTAAAMLNAANEEAVDAFLGMNLRFDRIPEVIDATLQALQVHNAGDIEQVLDADRQARKLAQKHIVHWQESA
ncbi:1-deoxy-D-xylulose-5-phosphate reductoisomerase [Endozoicomonas gorgoniicola]|uniref:1-deoxy-D-xylulose 5-phosphate reductoisomerase n=1 Tax=Endozoicomonas gorgoniicola TaxID=1234144 RepID=A0ABT3MV42_9GAMM|nr:1-deoxy-D-xylulose-5-phosphate reductoisomerase [Endozoicomonas gorgoniicola]MCW7553254.1 1-deoxy-D-xylulose-5-phosphate reductoisomerase [Endozoicomonas gorgoniicola]